MTAIKDSIYLASPVWLQNALLGLYGARLRRLRYGGVHRQVLASLLESQWRSAAEHEMAQLTSLNGLLEHAGRTVPFYRDAWRGAPRVGSVAELRRLPITRKADVQRAGRALISEDFARTPLTSIHTGGTTGTPLTIFGDAGTIQRNYAFFERLRHWAGTPDGCRVATFAGRILLRPSDSAPFWRMNRAANTLLLSSYHLAPATMSAYVEALVSWAPDLIDSYPSSLEPLARHLLATRDERVRPKAIITSSETLTSEVRTLLESAFGCKVFDHYGSAEMVALISQCEKGSYHVNPEFGIVELLANGEPARAGEPGEIVATGFINPVMPLIRYAMGDWAVWSDAQCGCGRQMRCLSEIGGRVDDVIVAPDGRRIGRLDPIFKSANSLFECRVVQDAADHLRIEFVGPEVLPSGEIERLVEALQIRVGSSMRIDAVRVHRIPRTARGKLRTVVNEWSRQ